MFKSLLYLLWKYNNTEIKDEVLGGERVFKGTRLSVLHTGQMILNGEKIYNLLYDYPYLKTKDVEYAKEYARRKKEEERRDYKKSIKRLSKESGYIPSAGRCCGDYIVSGHYCFMCPVKPKSSVG